MSTVPSPESITLAPYTGSWGYAQAAQLARRCLFGATATDIEQLRSMTMQKAVSTILTAPSAPTILPLVWYHGDLGGTNDGQTWVNLAYDMGNDFNRSESLGGWWINQMLTQGLSIVEKMTLFWHNHFATGMTTVGDARYMFVQNQLFRSNALGNFRSLVRSVTLDPAMLRYLSGNQNVAGAPNENYGRELQELFTIGKGTEVTSGDYTTYTEADVKAAAQLLTGWSDDPTTVKAVFTPANHVTTDIQFSARYNNTVIKGASDEAGALGQIDQLLTMIFNQNATARYICRKLFRWFVDYVIDDTIEQTIIGPMADTLIAGNFEIKPVLSQLLSSSMFYDPAYTGNIIKTPMDLVIGTMRTLGVALPDNGTVTTQYYGWIGLRSTGENLQMKILEPPNVAGWPEYYEAPQYHELWINSGTLDSRIKFLDDIVTNSYELPVQTYLMTDLDMIAVAKLSSDPSTATTLVSDLASLFFANALTSAQMQTLHDTLLPGLPDYEWTSEWNAYIAAPSDATKKAAVTNKLTALVQYMLQLAEYQLM